MPKSSGSWASTCRRGRLVVGAVLTVMIQLGSIPTIVVAWFSKVTAVGTDDPMNLEGGPTRGGLVLEGLPSLMPAWLMDLHERLVTCLMGVRRGHLPLWPTESWKRTCHRGGPSLGS